MIFISLGPSCYRSDIYEKKGKLHISHRYNLIPLLPSGPGGVLRELVVYDLPHCKCNDFFLKAKIKKWE